MQGLREFPGTIHLAAFDRLRNDTGQHLSEAVYLDYPGNALYVLPAMAPGEELQLDAIVPKPIKTKSEGQALGAAGQERKPTGACAPRGIAICLSGAGICGLQ